MKDHNIVNRPTPVNLYIIPYNYPILNLLQLSRLMSALFLLYIFNMKPFPCTINKEKTKKTVHVSRPEVARSRDAGDRKCAGSQKKTGFPIARIKMRSGQAGRDSLKSFSRCRRPRNSYEYCPRTIAWFTVTACTVSGQRALRI